MDELTTREFLERTPPAKKAIVTDIEIESEELVLPGHDHTRTVNRIRTPDIELHCLECKGVRFFKATKKGELLRIGEHKNDFLTYVCRNCQNSSKTFAITCIRQEGEEQWTVFKYGEAPSFGPPTPSRTITLIGPDRDAFLKGRRCENQGLGVGAFVYYRRVVENQKGRIFDEIIRVTQHLAIEPI
jgi:hypothetical protein